MCTIYTHIPCQSYTTTRLQDHLTLLETLNIKVYHKAKKCKCTLRSYYIGLILHSLPYHRHHHSRHTYFFMGVQWCTQSNVQCAPVVVRKSVVPDCLNCCLFRKLYFGKDGWMHDKYLIRLDWLNKKMFYWCLYCINKRTRKKLEELEKKNDLNAGWRCLQNADERQRGNIPTSYDSIDWGLCLWWWRSGQYLIIKYYYTGTDSVVEQAAVKDFYVCNTLRLSILPKSKKTQ